MRLFFALAAPRDTALAMADWRDRHFKGFGRPIPVANLHLTLAFIGELAPARLEQLGTAVDDMLARDGGAADTLALDQLGYFPRPGICWVGPGEWPDALEQLAARLAGAGRRAGGDGGLKDRFQPHVSLLRRCEQPPPAAPQAPAFALPYREFQLYESTRGRSGVRYQALAAWPLPAVT